MEKLIKFKGKSRVDGSEVFGDLIQKESKCYILLDDAPLGEDIRYYLIEVVPGSIEIAEINEALQERVTRTRSKKEIREVLESMKKSQKVWKKNLQEAEEGTHGS